MNLSLQWIWTTLNLLQKGINLEVTIERIMSLQEESEWFYLIMKDSLSLKKKKYNYIQTST